MEKKIKIVFIIVMLLSNIFYVGCWNKKELNELAIVSGFGIDPGAKKGEVTLTYQVINTSSFSSRGVSSTMTPFFTLETSGKTIFSAIRKSTKEISRKLYFGHLQVILINSELASKSGIKEVLDLMYRDPEIREDIPIIITRNQEVNKVLSHQSILENNNAISILKHIENTYENEACSRPVELREVVNYLTSPTADIYVPFVYLSPYNPNSELTATQNSKQGSVLKVGGFAIFKKDKLIGYLEDKDARALNFINDKVKGSVIVVPYKKHNQSLEIKFSNTKVKAEFRRGKPIMNINIEIIANLGEANGNIDLSKLPIITELEKATSQTIKKEVENVIKKVQQKYKVDIFHFGETIQKQKKKEWKNIGKDWEKEFVDLDVVVKVSTKIIDIGMKTKSIEGLMKEKQK